MLFGSKTWCLRENEMAILRRREKAMMRATCGVKMIEKRRSQEFMSFLGLKQWFPTFIKAHTPKISQCVLAPLKYFNMSRAGAILKARLKLRVLAFFLEISIVSG